MNTPTGIHIFGNQAFSHWLQPQLEASVTYSLAGTSESTETLRDLVDANKPRAVVIELSNSILEEAGRIGSEVQKGFKWASVLFVFAELDEPILKFSKAVKRRSWSMSSQGLIDRVSIDRVLAGTLTSNGFIDSSVVEFETELSAQASESANDDDADSEDEEPEEAA